MAPWWSAVVLVSMSAAAGADVGGIRLNERAQLGGSELVLNGAGLRKRAFFNVYVAGLYLTERRTSGAGVLALSGSKRVSITLMRSLPPRRLVDALMAGIRDNSSTEEELAVKDRLEDLTRTLLAIRQTRAGDVITFDWVPEAGTVLALNGEVRGNAIPGDDVYRALLRVWLGDRPTSGDLKRALLGTATR